jgi:glycosyltransferase involved in cell wall biosynthesis
MSDTTRFKIGIAPDLRPNAGGVYQYSVTMLAALAEWSHAGCPYEFVVLVDDIHHAALKPTPHPSWLIRPLKSSSAKRLLKRALTKAGVDHAARAAVARVRLSGYQKDIDAIRSRPQDRAWLKGLGIDLMIYPSPDTLSFEAGIPYVMAVHDLQHRLQPEFPEVSADGEWERREYLFRNGARHATVLLSDSDTGREDILNFYGEYGAAPDRVKVLPFLPAAYLPSSVPAADRDRVRITYQLPPRYLFYPAQFWPHKNHARIIRALHELKNKYSVEVSIVFCGSAEGKIRTEEYRKVVTLAREAGIEKNVINLGYVHDQDMAALYSGATALVMPTFFGPTNIPVLEAWALHCPVITSDIRGIREQVGDAAILVDPKSVESIAEGIWSVWKQEQLRNVLSVRGRQRLAQYTSQDFQQRLIEAIEHAKSNRAC